MPEENRKRRIKEEEEEEGQKDKKKQKTHPPLLFLKYLADIIKMSEEGSRKRRTKEEEPEYLEREEREGQRGRKRQKKYSPLYYTYRPLISKDKDKAYTIATVDNTNESSSILNQGSYHRARKLVGEEKWNVARELISDGRIDNARMIPDAKAFITTRVALAKNWDRTKCCRFRRTPCTCPIEENRTDVNSAMYCCKTNGCMCSEIHNCFNRWDIMVKGTCVYSEETKV